MVLTSRVRDPSFTTNQKAVHAKAKTLTKFIATSSLLLTNPCSKSDSKAVDEKRATRALFR